MIQKLLPLLAFIGMFSWVSAQSSPVRESERTMSFGTRPCFQIQFRNTDDALMLDEWKKFAKERFGAKLKKDKKSGEWYATGLSYSAISANDITIRSTIEENGEDVMFTVWFDLGSSFLNRRESPVQSDEAVRALTDFYVQARRAIVSLELKAAEDKLKEIEKRKRQLEKDKDGLLKDIENYEAKIKKAQEDVKNNEHEQNSNVADQEAQRRAIETIKVRLQNVESERQ